MKGQKKALEAEIAAKVLNLERDLGLKVNWIEITRKGPVGFQARATTVDHAGREVTVKIHAKAE